ncbi:glycoside hydrolase family 3 N-terminal domain-containing protein [Christiangramia flava]|uniref:beta-N-acetylhexosaminidase n=1 Tax=Christiangramia flava JLT2011 TaxID=1229726 RepID=A0A1L7I8X3_9FLAO|nr:glycoside hydrolase family 3 N-terminal domain-containing protein [Christiangramia flava]APU70029.1 Beta-hexosaminidase [Christiangramia flava JLT2011]OSS39514.1 Beta-hexosaminidase [Christiangramia flava JLT2011]
MKVRKAPNFLFFFGLLFSISLQAQVMDPLQTSDATAQQKWVDSVYNSLSLEERIGQLYMASIWSQNDREADSVRKWIDKYHIGGLIFSKGGPVKQAKLTNEFQQKSKVPLLVGMDAEWGLAMRLDSTFAIPWNMTLGAVQDDQLVRQAGAAISRHARRLGVHFNFAPVVDINTNPDNPIIGNRSFGETREIVTKKALAFMVGMHQEKVLSTAKHFPGHGDTESDSHKTLPSIGFDRERIDTIELYPYKKLISAGLSSVMVAHLDVPALEERRGLPASLSKDIITGILKKNMGFQGLIFTDALGMKGVSRDNKPGEVDLNAFLAGNDVLLMSEDIAKSSANLVEAYNNGIITEDRLALSVKKILRAKFKVGLQHFKPIETESLVHDLNMPRDFALNENLFQSAITLVKNNKAIVPIKKITNKKIAYVNLGNDDGSVFLNELKKYTKVDWVKSASLSGLLEKLKSYDEVVVGFHKPDNSPWASYKFSSQELVWLHEIARENRVILSVFTKPYALLDVKSFSNIESIIVGYQNHTMAQQKVAQLIFGATEAKGKLPVSIRNEFPVGTGFQTKTVNRLAYGIPENVGMNSEKLQEIDSIMKVAIDEKMTPGAQIIVARRGKVIFQKNYGYQTYEKDIPVTDTTIYDLASMTKILATLPIVMQLDEEGVLSFDTTIGEMFPEYSNSNKKNIRLQDMLMHYARLSPWIPFYISTIDRKTNTLLPDYYQESASADFNTQVAINMFIRKDIGDTIVKTIMDSDLRKKREYLYSDLPYYLLKYYLERHFQASLQSLTQQRLYQKLGANNTGYLPLTKFDTLQIAPTEDDKLWRHQLVRGFVHDQGAAMQGGIGGHAGLFSNANDVAKIMQMYLDGGAYGGEKLLKPETIEKYNTCYYCEQHVRRGVGFDKPQLGEAGPTCNCASKSSFGHSGFTGTFTWADPEEEIVYVFLSNRVYPDSNNRKLIREDIRSNIQQVIYDAIEN